MKSYKSEAGFAYLRIRMWIQMERKFEICNVSFEEVLKRSFLFARETRETREVWQYSSFAVRELWTVVHKLRLT